MTEHIQNELIVRNRWNDIYEKDVLLEIDDNIPRICDLFKERSITAVLDLGCGSGRHTVYLAQEGFDVYGIDIAHKGVKRAKILLDKRGIHAALSVGSVRQLPYKNEVFDSIISVKVIHHGRIGAIRETIKEIHRVLKPGGLIFVTVLKKTRKKSRPSKIIALNTVVPIEGREKDIVHYAFTKDVLLKEFESFKILDMWLDNRYYCLLGEKSV